MEEQEDGAQRKEQEGYHRRRNAIDLSQPQMRIIGEPWKKAHKHIGQREINLFLRSVDGIEINVLFGDIDHDIEEISELYIRGLEFVYVSTAMELVPLVLQEKQVKNPVKLPAKIKKEKEE